MKRLLPAFALWVALALAASATGTASANGETAVSGSVTAPPPPSAASTAPPPPAPPADSTGTAAISAVLDQFIAVNRAYESVCAQAANEGNFPLLCELYLAAERRTRQIDFSACPLSFRTVCEAYARIQEVNTKAMVELFREQFLPNGSTPPSSESLGPRLKELGDAISDMGRVVVLEARRYGADTSALEKEWSISIAQDGGNEEASTDSPPSSSDAETPAKKAGGKPCKPCFFGDLTGICTTPTCPNYGNPHSQYRP